MKSNVYINDGIVGFFQKGLPAVPEGVILERMGRRSDQILRLISYEGESTAFLQCFFYDRNLEF